MEGRRPFGFRDVTTLRRETGSFQEVLNRAYEMTLDARIDTGLDENDFRDLYTDERVDADLRTIKEIEKNIASKEDTPEDREAQKRSTVLEGVMAEQIEQSNWLGEDVATNFTSRYDDLVNHIDIVLERQTDDGSSVLGLGVDVTRGFQSMQRKIYRIREELVSGQMGKIKYFDSQVMSMRGEMRNIPRVVVGVSNETLERVARRWVSGAKRELGTDRIQLVLLEEIRFQLEAFRNFSQKQRQVLNAEKLDQQLRFINRVIASDEKVALAEKVRFNPHTDFDQVFQELRRQVSSIIA